MSSLCLLASTFFLFVSVHVHASECPVHACASWHGFSHHLARPHLIGHLLVFTRPKAQKMSACARARYFLRCLARQASLAIFLPFLHGVREDRREETADDEAGALAVSVTVSVLVAIESLLSRRNFCTEQKLYQQNVSLHLLHEYLGSVSSRHRFDVIMHVSDLVQSSRLQA